ncbi:MAG: response regulator transcription factor [Burkholderiales bacterium]|nr:response regulator transcription factor [Burkholderiales bacterium]
MRLLIVDDEPPARARLKRLLAAHADVQVVDEAADGLQALALVESLRPDALLLDVQMPELGGLDVAASLPDVAEGGPAVVFVTAFDAYALPAFDAAAVDYLLKPVDPARLARAIERLRLRRPSATTRPAAERLVVSERGRLQVIDCRALLWLQAADNYVELHTADRMHLLRRTLDGLLADLGPGFVRIHRSRAVALAAVSRVEAAERGNATVHLRNGAALACSRAWRKGLDQALLG